MMRGHYDRLADFIQNRMRMSHVYPPVMLMTLLQHHGTCHERDIASALLANDRSQVEYYTKITNNLVGRVLRKHHFVERDRRTGTYTLVGYDRLTADQRHALVGLCEDRLAAFVEKRGRQIFERRKGSSASISGTARYETLKRAGFHCELCGVAADIRALEVKRIVPGTSGGSDALSNLEALCFSCCSITPDRDDADFRQVRESYTTREQGCIFCQAQESQRTRQNELAYAIRDRFPVTNLHTLIIPNRHVKTYFELHQSEINACTDLLNRTKTDIEDEDATVLGFNVGINNGEISGQTVPHCHIHLIPRRKGDVENPRGGIRHTIPGKGNY